MILADLITNVAATNVEKLPTGTKMKRKENLLGRYVGSRGARGSSQDNGYIMTSHISILSSKATDSQ
jgi:hypothetical protein